MFLSSLHFTNLYAAAVKPLEVFYLQKPRPGTLPNQTQARYLTFSITSDSYIQK